MDYFCYYYFDFDLYVVYLEHYYFNRYHNNLVIPKYIYRINIKYN